MQATRSLRRWEKTCSWQWPDSHTYCTWFSAPRITFDVMCPDQERILISARRTFEGKLWLLSLCVQSHFRPYWFVLMGVLNINIYFVWTKRTKERVLPDRYSEAWHFHCFKYFSVRFLTSVGNYLVSNCPSSKSFDYNKGHLTLVVSSEHASITLPAVRADLCQMSSAAPLSDAAEPSSFSSITAHPQGITTINFHFCGHVGMSRPCWPSI